MNPAVKCLRDATTAKGWTLADLAFVIGCPPARLSAWLHPHHLISPQQARIFEAALSVDPYHLLIDLQIPWQMSALSRKGEEDWRLPNLSSSDFRAIEAT
jgi:transcriptional regulator with XRE-family HTH domain